MADRPRRGSLCRASTSSPSAQVVRLRDRKVILDEELYEDFEKNYQFKRTNRGTHHFHMMEFESSIVGEGDARRTAAGRG